MVHRDSRLAPLSLRHALLLLVPLALLGTALLGLLAQSATANHGAVPAPNLLGPANPVDSDATPQWTFLRPADTTVTGEPTVVGADTQTVTITHEYDTQCIYGSAPVSDSGFSAGTPTCGVVFSPTAYGYNGVVTDDGQYVLSVRTVEKTTTSTVTEYADGTPTSTDVIGPTAAYSAVESAAYIYDTTAPTVTVTVPTGPSYAGWTVTATDANAVDLSCSLTDPAGVIAPVDSSLCIPGTVQPPLGDNGTYTLSVLGTDAAGNAAPVASASLAYDGKPPVITFGPLPAGPSNQQPTWTWSLSEGSTTTCALSRDAGAPTTVSCTEGSYPATLTTPGSYTLTVTATDAAGNSGSSTSAAYLFDNAGPAVSIDPPDSTGSNQTVTWTVTIGEGRTGTCTVTGSAAVACATGATLSATVADGASATLTVTAADAVGNATTDSATYTRDSSVGFAVTVPAGPSSDRTPTWTFTSTEPVTLEACVLEADGAAVADPGGACTATGYTSGELPTSNGTSYVLVVTVTDAVGNTQVFRSTPAYVLDTTPAALTLQPAAGQGSVDNVTQPSWIFVGDTWTNPVCLFTVAGDSTHLGGSCTATGFVAPVLTQPSGTQYELRVTVVDSAGNTSSATTTYLLDTVAEAAKVSGPVAYDDDVRPVWTWTAETGATVTCVLTDAAGRTFDVSCASGTSTPAADLPETSSTVYTFVVTVTDALDNSTVLTFDTYRLDTVADAAKVSGPAAHDDDVRPVWTWTAEDGAAVTCTLTDQDGATFAVSCDEGTSTPAADLPETSSTVYTLVMTVTDSLGNQTVLTFDPYELDTIADAAKVSQPAAYDDDVRPVWTWTAETGATVTCVLTDAAGRTFDVSCANGTSTPAADLPETSSTVYTLVVTVTDSLDNSTVLTFDTYRLDTIADHIAGTAPVSPDNSTTPQWTWTAEPGATVTCVLTGPDGEVFNGVCTTHDSFTSPTLPSTTGQDYVLVVTIVDVLDNTTVIDHDPYHLDTVLELDVDGPTGPSPDREPVWNFVAEPLVTLECTLIGPGGAAVTGGICDQNGYRAPPLTTDGDHVLSVRGVDAAGNDVTQTFTYDLDTLHFTIDGPTGPSPDRTPTWTFTDEPYDSAHCVLTGPDGEVHNGPCTTRSSFTAGELPLTPGADYVLTVTVIDSIGNRGAITAPTYRLDTQLPVATITVPASPSRTVSVTWTVASDEALSSATCELRRDGAVVLSLASCPGSTTVSLPGDGRYDLVVTLIDLAGNRSSTTSTVLVHDATIPTAPGVTPTTTTTNRTTATWTVTAEGGTSVTTCRVLHDGALFADWTTCGGTFSLPLGGDGSYVLEAVSTDAVGPGPTTRVTYLLDTVAPAAPRLTGPTGPAQGRTPTWSVGTDSGTTVECRLMHGGTVVTDWSACAGSLGADLTGLPDGAYVLEARATDLAGNVSPVGTATPYVLDTTAPLAPVVTGPAGPSQLRTPRFTWTGETGSSAECLLSRDGVAAGGWSACASGFAPSLDRDGTWTLTVRLTDAAGNVSDAAASGGYVLDTTPPPTPVVTPPKTPGRDLAPSWGAVVETGATTECRLLTADGTQGAWALCALPHVTSLEGRPDGTYVLEVRATDAAGNLGPVGSGTYVLDTVAPVAAVLTAATSPSRSRTPSFSFTVEPGATTRCRLTHGTTVISDFTACGSPTQLDLTGLPDGTYTLSVRVADAAGNPGPAASATYVLDTTGPASPVLTLSPASPSPVRSVTWAFTSEPGGTLICRLTFPTGAVREISGCASPLVVDLAGLPDGTYTLTVRAVDLAGNVGAVLTVAHVLDSTALQPPQVTGPVTPGSSRTPRWTITSTDPTECRLTRGSTVLRDWAACSGSFTADLFGQPDGSYALSVRSKSAGGAVSAVAVSRYVLDTTAPGAATVVGPPTPSTNRRPVWTVASNELGATAECRVLLFGSVLSDWAPCGVTVEGSPYAALDLTGRGDGTYTLVVRLTDAAGNRGSETSSSYVLDTSAPVGVGVTGPVSPGNDTSPTWTFTTAGSVELECRLTSVDGVVSDWDTCLASFTADLTDLPDGTYTLAVRAVSEAGTPGPETTSAYVLSTAAPDGPTALTLSGTKPTSNDRSPTWTFTLPSGTTGRCAVLRGAVPVYEGPCSSPFTLDLSSAVDGSYTLTVTAVDKAGTRSVGASSTYVLDTVATSAPEFTLEPGAGGSTLDPQWRFTVVYGATAECRLVHDGVAGEWVACTSPYTAVLTGRPDGRYVLEVRAVDQAGNSSAPTRSSYLLDRSGTAVATFTRTPETPGTERLVSWEFRGPDGAALECRLVAAGGTTAWTACVGYSLDLRNRPDGDYVLEVRVVAADGRVGSPSRATYTLDTLRPDAPRFSATPPDAGNDAQPTWSWDATTDDRVECRLVRVGGGTLSDWAPCTSPHAARLTSQGTYALELRVVDAAGNVSDTTSSSYRFDTTAPPAPAFTSRPSASGADRTVTWTFALPPDVTAVCTVTRGASRLAEGPCSGRYELNLAGQPDGTYTLTVRFTDSAGNAGPPASSRYTLRTVGLSGPSRVDPPSGGSGSGPVPPGPGRGGTGVSSGPGTAPAPEGSSSRPAVPSLPTDEDVQRSTVERPGIFAPDRNGQEVAEATPPQPQGTPRARNPLLADPLPVPDVPEALREAVTSTITRPTLPLALLAIVLLFLLAQNRIDRRDPKLASAPVEAEPELDFTTIVRRPGGALS